MAAEADVRRIALSLPQTVEKPSYGTPGFRVADKLFARIHDEPGILVAWCPSVDEKQALIADAPETFFSTAHYEGYPVVLVRLAVIDKPELREVLTEAWRSRAPKRLVQQMDA